MPEASTSGVHALLLSPKPGCALSPTLSQRELHERFLAALGDIVLRADDADRKPLTLEAMPPLPSRLRVYIYNATNPPGGRSGGEHKIQFMVPDQARGERGNFDSSGERAVVVAGYAEDHDAFILWDATLHRDFAWSANAQVRTETIEQAVAAGGVATQTRALGSGAAELVIAVPAAALLDGLVARFDATPEPVPAAPAATPRPARSRGKRYVRAATASPEPVTRVFEVDPDAVDRGTQAHDDIQNALSDAIEVAGLEPLSPIGTDPRFDVAWMNGDVAFVTEVKSLTDANEERQLRLALGQVLSYAFLLDWEGAAHVQPVIAVERELNAPHWVTMCDHYGVRLVWPDVYGTLF